MDSFYRVDAFVGYFKTLADGNPLGLSYGEWAIAGAAAVGLSDAMFAWLTASKEELDSSDAAEKFSSKSMIRGVEGKIREALETKRKRAAEGFADEPPRKKAKVRRQPAVLDMTGNDGEDVVVEGPSVSGLSPEEKARMAAREEGEGDL
jgi:hypothetical protein